MMLLIWYVTTYMCTIKHKVLLRTMALSQETKEVE